MNCRSVGTPILSANLTSDPYGDKAFNDRYPLRYKAQLQVFANNSKAMEIRQRDVDGHFLRPYPVYGGALFQRFNNAGYILLKNRFFEYRCEANDGRSRQDPGESKNPLGGMIVRTHPEQRPFFKSQLSRSSRLSGKSFLLRFTGAAHQPRQQHRGRHQRWFDHSNSGFVRFITVSMKSQVRRQIRQQSEGCLIYPKTQSLHQSA